MITSVQFLRGIAVMLVVFFHSVTMIKERAGYGEPFTNTGAAGVDIFFVISGFVIFLASNKKNTTAPEFFARRLIRIAPAYWLYTSLTVALLFFVPGAYQNLQFELLPTISSYLFMLSANSSGGVGTLLGVGWTIAYEMYFYVLLCLAIWLTPNARFFFVSLAILVGFTLSLFLKHPPTFTLVALSPLPLEFLAGCAIAKLHLRSAHLPSAIGLIAVAIGFLIIWYSGDTKIVTSDFWRVIYFGMPAVLILYGFVSIDTARVVQFPRFTLLIGDASYSIYLCHQFVLSAAGKIWISLGLTLAFPSVTLLIIGISASIFAGLFSYYLFEKPITARLNFALSRWVTKERSQAQTATSSPRRSQ